MKNLMLTLAVIAVGASMATSMASASTPIAGSQDWVKTILFGADGYRH